MNKDEIAPPYFGNEMNAFNDGVQASMQFRLAFDFVKAGLRPETYERAPTLESDAHDAVEYAYLLAEELMSQGLALDYVRAITDSHEVNSATRKMIDRQVDAGVHQAKSSQRAQAEMIRGAVAIPIPGANGPIPS